MPTTQLVASLSWCRLESGTPCGVDTVSAMTPPRHASTFQPLRSSPINVLNVPAGTLSPSHSVAIRRLSVGDEPTAQNRFGIED